MIKSEGSSKAEIVSVTADFEMETQRYFTQPCPGKT